MRRVVSKYEHGCCPACGRGFRVINDYPRVEVLGFELLPLPETIDTFSSAASALQAKAHRSGRAEAWDVGINVTPKLAEACSEEQVEQYLAALQQLVGCEIDPKDLMPRWRADSYFSFAHPLDTKTTPDDSSRHNRLYMAVAEPFDDDVDAAPAANGERFAHVVIYGDGINFGSGGGPTLQRLGVIARLRYRGLLKSEFRDPKSEPSVVS
jgi:hypothetical protein